MTTPTTALMPLIKQQYFDANGVPLASGQIYTYQAGTLTPQATYTDSTGLFLNTNPVLLDATGKANIWLDVTLNYKFVVEDVNSVVQYTEDNISGSAPGALTVASIGSVAPSLTGAGASGTWGINITGTSAYTNALNTTTFPVNVSGSAAPSIGEVLVATSPTTATWQTPGAGGVTSLNSETGAVVIVAGSGITVTPAGQNITIAASGGGSPGSFSPTAAWTNVIGSRAVGTTYTNSSGYCIQLAISTTTSVPAYFYINGNVRLYSEGNYSGTDYGTATFVLQAEDTYEVGSGFAIEAWWEFR